MIPTMTTPSTAIGKREAILNATLELLACRGFHGFSIKQLATQAGVAAGTIYLYFEDRDALIRALHFQIIEKFAAAVLNNHDESLSLQAQHHQVCSNLWQFCISHPEILLSKAQFDHLPPEVLRSQREAAWVLFKPLTDLFENGRRSGVIKAFPDDVLSSLCLEPHMTLARQHILGLVTINERCLDQIIEASWHAIAHAEHKN